MTAVGSKKHNATGRSTGSRKQNRHTAIKGQFAPRTIDMLRSPAYRVMSYSAHRILARLEIELADHGGDDNGKLPATYDQFVEYGVHRASIAPAIRELTALGFIEVTERGRAGNAEWRRPSKFRLTYRHAGAEPATDEWAAIKTIVAAEAIAASARKEKSQYRNPNHRSVRNQNRNPVVLGTESGTTSHGSESDTTLYISGGVSDAA